MFNKINKVLLFKFNEKMTVFRYESTITAQFFGHTHYDEYELFYDTSDFGRAVNVAFIGPSVTPYADLNPGYRIYYVDGDHDKSTRVSKKSFLLQKLICEIIKISLIKAPSKP